MTRLSFCQRKNAVMPCWLSTHGKIFDKLRIKSSSIIIILWLKLVYAEQIHFSYYWRILNSSIWIDVNYCLPEISYPYNLRTWRWDIQNIEIRNAALFPGAFFKRESTLNKKLKCEMINLIHEIVFILNFIVTMPLIFNYDSNKISCSAAELQHGSPTYF